MYTNTNAKTRGQLIMRKIMTKRNLKEVVYQRLKKGIINHEVLPGMRLREEELAEKLGVSRTPIREAINRLHQEGIVVVIPRRGAYVARLTREEIIENLFIREVLEGLAARLAAENISSSSLAEMRACITQFVSKDLLADLENYSQANVQLHKMIIAASKCKKLINLIHNLFDQMDVVRLRTISFPGRAEKSLIEHMEIIDALEKKDGARAEKLVRAHIQDLRKTVTQSSINPEGISIIAV
jgi:DNA-binding GntR family transcriptional regulator